MKKIYKLICFVVVGVIALILIAYFALTSSYAIQNFILPYIEKETGITIKVEKIVLSPLMGKLRISKLSVIDEEMYSIKGNDFDCKINILKLLTGVVKIEHLNIDKFKINIRQNDSDTKKELESIIPVDGTEKNNQLKLKLDINNLSVKDLALKYEIKRDTDSKSSIIEIKKFNFNIPHLKTDELSNISYNGLLNLSCANGESELNGDFTGIVKTKINSEFIPEILKVAGKSKFDNNITSISIDFLSNKNIKLEMQPFSLDVKIEQLPLLPFFKAIIDGSTSKRDGTVEELSLNLKGHDLFNVDLHKNVTGELKVDLKDLYIPNKATKGEVFASAKIFSLSVSLSDLVNGLLKVNYLNLIDTNIDIVQNMMEENNMDMKTVSVETENKKKSIKHSNVYNDQDAVQKKQSFMLDLKKINIDNFNVRYKAKRQNSSKTSIVKLNKFNLNIPELETGKLGNINYNGLINMNCGNGTSKLAGTLSGNIKMKFDKYLLPEIFKLKGQVKFGEEISPIYVNFKSNKNLVTNRPFELKVNIKRFLLLPIFKAFISGGYSESKGCIKELTFQAKGTDLLKINPKKNLTASLHSNLEDIDLPVKLAKFAIVKLIFLPIEIISNINSFTKTNIVPEKLNDAFKSVNEITEGLQTMYFKTGNIDISLDDKKIEVKNFNLKGGSVNTVRRIVFNGYVDVDGKMELNSKTSFIGIVVPIELTGTVNEPKAKILMVLPGLIVDTAGNLIVTGVDLGRDVGRGGLNASKYLLKTGVEGGVRAGMTGVNLTKKTYATSVDLTKNMGNAGVDLTKKTFVTSVDLTKNMGNAGVDLTKKTFVTSVDLTKNMGNASVDLTKKTYVTGIKLTKSMGDAGADLTKKASNTVNILGDSIGSGLRKTVNGAKGIGETVSSSLDDAIN